MKIRNGLVLGGVVLLLLAGCGDEGGRGGGTGDGGDDTTGRGAPRLDGTAWIGTRITEDGAPRALVPGSQLRVEFRDGNISVNAGCNGMGGEYTVSDAGELSVGVLAGTMMACAPPLMEQDDWVSGTVFARPLQAKVDGDTLTLSRTGLELVLTDRKVASPDAELEGTTWQLDGIRSGDAVSSVPAGVRTPTLSIAEDGSVAVDTGCNRGHGTAEVNGELIAFGPLSTTRMACPSEDARQTEAAVVAVLEGDVTWSITEKALTLDHGDRGLTWRVAP